MPRSRYCWPSEKRNLNFTRIFWYRHAQIAILLTVAKSGMLFYGGNLISTCLDSDKWNFNFTRIFRYQHAQIAILLTVGKFGMPFYEGNLTSTCLDCDTVGRQKSQSPILRRQFDVSMRKVTECCSKMHLYRCLQPHDLCKTNGGLFKTRLPLETAGSTK